MLKRFINERGEELTGWPEISTRLQVPPEERLGGIKEINGVKYGEDIILGVPVILPA